MIQHPVALLAFVLGVVAWSRVGFACAYLTRELLS